MESIYNLHFPSDMVSEHSQGRYLKVYLDLAIEMQS